MHSFSKQTAAQERAGSRVGFKVEISFETLKYLQVYTFAKCFVEKRSKSKMGLGKSERSYFSKMVLSTEDFRRFENKMNRNQTAVIPGCLLHAEHLLTHGEEFVSLFLSWGAPVGSLCSVNASLGKNLDQLNGIQRAVVYHEGKSQGWEWNTLLQEIGFCVRNTWRVSIQMFWSLLYWLVSRH